MQFIRNLQKADQEVRLWIFAIVSCLLFIMTNYFHPDFFDNELLYSQNPIKLVDPSFLANDLFMDKFYPFFLYFDALTAPLYAVFDYLTAVFILRILVWWFEIWALSRLMRTLGMRWWGFILLFVLWINVEQTLVAGDWIFRSANSKPVAYGFVFLALNSLIQGKFRNAGIYGGLVTMMHVLIGFWSNLAIGLSVALMLGKKGSMKSFTAFLIPVAAISLIGLIPPFYGEFLSQGATLPVGASGEVARLSVLLANPFHLDPDHFMTGFEHLKVAIFFISSLLMMRLLLPPDKSMQMTLFLLFLCIFFLSGIVARHGEWYRYLKYYPFRLADSFVPLLFWAGFVLFFQQVAYRMERGRICLVIAVPLIIGVSNYAIDLCEPTPRYGFSLGSFSEAMLHTEPRMTLYRCRERGREWYHFLVVRSPKDDLEEMHLWIRENTPRESVFLNLPWDMHFSLKAQRSEFVAIKPPPNSRIYPWLNRMVMVNRGPLQSVGFGIYKELRKNYPLLTREDIVSIKSKNNLDFFLTNSDVKYIFPIAHSNKSYRLYDLRGVVAKKDV